MRSALIAREGGWPYLLGVYCVATNPCDIFINERLVDHLRTCNAFDGRLYSLLGVERVRMVLFCLVESAPERLATAFESGHVRLLRFRT